MRKVLGGAATPVVIMGSLAQGDAESTPLPVSLVDPLPVSLVDRLVVIAVAPTISTGIYAAGDAIGGKLTLANAARVAGGGGAITKVIIVDDDSEMAPIDLVLFKQDFTPTADNAPFDPTDADLENCIGYISIAATDYVAFNDNSVASKMTGRHMPFDFVLAAGVTSLFGQMVVRSTPTYTAVGDITVKMTVEQR